MNGQYLQKSVLGLSLLLQSLSPAHVPFSRLISQRPHLSNGNIFYKQHRNVDHIPIMYLHNTFKNVLGLSLLLELFSPTLIPFPCLLHAKTQQTSRYTYYVLAQYLQNSVLGLSLHLQLLSPTRVLFFYLHVFSYLRHLSNGSIYYKQYGNVDHIPIMYLHNTVKFLLGLSLLLELFPATLMPFLVYYMQEHNRHPAVVTSYLGRACVRHASADTKTTALLSKIACE